jgi:hypothetical protein
MISLKVLSTAAAVVLAVPLFVPGESFAQERPTFGGGAAARPTFGGGGAAARPTFGGGGGAHFGGGAASRPTFSGAARPTFGGGGAFTRPTPSGPAVASGPRYSGGGWHGGYRGGYRHHGYGGGFIPGAVAGAVIGGAIASQGYGYGYGPGYDPGYVADPSYYDDGSGYVAAGPQGGGDDSVAYCMQTYRSYDPRSGTYMGNDGYRHPCP